MTALNTVVSQWDLTLNVTAKKKDFNAFFFSVIALNFVMQIDVTLGPRGICAKYRPG